MSIWDKYPDFTDDELRSLVVLTAQVILDSDSATEFAPDFLEVSTMAASRQLVPLLQADAADRGQIQKILEDDTLSKQLALKVLGEVQEYPELTERIATAYEVKSQKMATPELLLLTGAVLILSIKLKEINWGEKKISFYKSSEAVKSFLAGFLKGGIE